jgi:uncharacterized repeat protein (TIGR01451 family)
LVTLALAPTAWAGTLDQEQAQTSTGGTTVSGPSSGIVGGTSAAQTITAGISGHLDQVDLYINNITGTDPLTVEIRDVDSNGAPGTTVLASTSATYSLSTPDWVSFTFSSAASVSAGTQYAIVAYTSGSSEYSWFALFSGNAYADGALYQSLASPPTTWSTVATGDADHVFKTYVTPFSADLSLSIVGPSKAGTRSTITYILTVNNAGPDDASNVVLTDNLPFGSELTAVTTSQGECTRPGRKVQKVVCNLGDIAGGGSSDSAVTLKISARAIPSYINNVASVSSDITDPNPSNNTASFSTAISK